MRPHGTVSRYSNDRCRCAKCRRANADANREYRNRTGRTRPLEIVNAERRAAIKHGTHWMYVGLGCRCEKCRRWSREDRRRYRQTPASVSCPNCGAMLANPRGLATHYGKMHPK